MAGNFTAEQIADAIANPKPGDVWKTPADEREVTMMLSDGLQWIGGYGSRICKFKTWRHWTRNATLIQRGA